MLLIWVAIFVAAIIGAAEVVYWLVTRNAVQTSELAGLDEEIADHSAVS